jgi:hypothetical protein
MEEPSGNSRASLSMGPARENLSLISPRRACGSIRDRFFRAPMIERRLCRHWALRPSPDVVKRLQTRFHHPHSGN